MELTTTQIQEIKEHMIDDKTLLKRKYNAKRLSHEIKTISINELEGCIADGWEEVKTLKHKAKIQKAKKIGIAFEDDIWCMFYRLGFKILNLDEKLVVRWGENPEDKAQLDVVAIGDEAIFVVECKATQNRRQANFKDAIEKISYYKEGVTKALQQIYGKNKKVKFIFATRNYIFPNECEDTKRLQNNRIFQFTDNTYNYINELIKSYKDTVIYQFYGLMFRHDRINNEKIRIPALKGNMGGHDYYMLSIEPAKLLKIGFVLHRTRANTQISMPTYQRLLVPSRLKGIGEFIDKGGYFPNTVIVNFSDNQNNRVQFEPIINNNGIECSVNEKTELGYLVIPNAYCIAYIIDGQHRVYGYAGSQKKDTNTIPVVAFDGLPSEEQLRIFMDINEHQKAVNPALRLDLMEDINWDSPRVDSRLKALRSSIVKYLGISNNSVLVNKISVGEDTAKLAFKPFDNALTASSLLPKATQTTYTAYQDICLYDIQNMNFDSAMKESRKRIVNLIEDSYGYVYNRMCVETEHSDEYEKFIECNRGTYAFISLISSLNEHLIKNKQLTQKSSTFEQIKEMSKYFSILIEYLCDMPEEDKNLILVMKGAAADKLWLRKFQNAIHQKLPSYNPEGLEKWLENQDNDLQNVGKELGLKIEAYLKQRVLQKLKELYGENWEGQVKQTKSKCLDRMDEDTEEVNWPDFMDLTDCKEIIEKKWQIVKENDDSYKTFEQEFSIPLMGEQSCKSKSDKLKWLTDLISFRKAWINNKKMFTKEDVNELHFIHQSLIPIEDDV